MLMPSASWSTRALGPCSTWTTMCTDQRSGRASLSTSMCHPRASCSAPAASLAQARSPLLRRLPRTKTSQVSWSGTPRSSTRQLARWATSILAEAWTPQFRAQTPRQLGRRHARSCSEGHAIRVLHQPPRLQHLLLRPLQLLQRLPLQRLPLQRLPLQRLPLQRLLRQRLLQFLRQLLRQLLHQRRPLHQPQILQLTPSAAGASSATRTLAATTQLAAAERSATPTRRKPA